MTADVPAVSLAALRSLVSRVTDRPIVVVGDVMLDQFTIGRVQRISPEAPVPVVEHIGDEVRLGGAANVAHNIRALGATPRLVGLVGRDEAADVLRQALAAAGLDAAGLFEYNFGDSEFLMLFLVLVTLPYAADHPAADADAR